MGLGMLDQSRDQGLHGHRPPWPTLVSLCAYLRCEHGLDIETIAEEHGPPFEGTHARYVLRSAVTCDDEVRA